MLSSDIFNYVVVPFMDLEQLYLNRDISSMVMDELKVRREQDINNAVDLAIKYDDFLLLSLESISFRYRSRNSWIHCCIQVRSWNVYPLLLYRVPIQEICNEEHYRLLEDPEVPDEILVAFKDSLRYITQSFHLSIYPCDLSHMLLHHIYPTHNWVRLQDLLGATRSRNKIGRKLLKAEKIIIDYLLSMGYTHESFLACHPDVKNSIYCYLLSKRRMEFSKLPKRSLFAIYQQLYNEQLLTKKLVVDLLFHCYSTYDESQLYLQMHWLAKYCKQVGIHIT